MAVQFGESVVGVKVVAAVHDHVVQGDAGEIGQLLEAHEKAS